MSQSAQADLTKVLAALKGLHRAFPIEERLKTQACENTLVNYLTILSRWIRTASAPAPDGFDPEALDELMALDAIYLTEDERAIGLAPFCPVETDIAVRFPHETVSALSALDALALPRLLETAGIIETTCPVTGQPISIQMDAQGKPMPEDVDKAIVVFQKISDHIHHYSMDVAPGIRFVLPMSTKGFGQALALPEAAAVAHAFYAFQRKMLGGSLAGGPDRNNQQETP